LYLLSAAPDGLSNTRRPEKQNVPFSFPGLRRLSGSDRQEPRTLSPGPWHLAFSASSMVQRQSGPAGNTRYRQGTNRAACPLRSMPLAQSVKCRGFGGGAPRGRDAFDRQMGRASSVGFFAAFVGNSGMHHFFSWPQRLCVSARDMIFLSWRVCINTPEKTVRGTHPTRSVSLPLTCALPDAPSKEPSTNAVCRCHPIVDEEPLFTRCHVLPFVAFVVKDPGFGQGGHGRRGK
jgi:hypothetical protein